MQRLGRLLVLVGSCSLLLGVILIFGERLGFRFGRLPLDFRVERGNFTFYFPLGTSILISLVLSLLFMVLNRR